MNLELLRGEIASGKNLDSAARLRTPKNEAIKVDESEIEKLIEEGYEVKAHYKSGVRLTRPLEDWRLFENKIWLMFHKFGFSHMNADSSFMLNISKGDEPIWRQIDVLAKDENNVFVVECKHGQELKKKNLRLVLSDLISTQGETEIAIKKLFDDRKLKVTFIIATKNIIWRAADNRRVKDAKKPLFKWDDETIGYLSELASLADIIGEAARYQLFSILFPNRETFVMENPNVAAIKGKAGKWTYYSFVAKPSQLLKICSVNRRVAKKANIDKEARETTLAYQRMLRTAKVKQINSYVEAGNFFPNSIIIVFDKEPNFHFASNDKLDHQLGYLQLPNKYASAWVLDGQHRLYGYANTSRVDSAPLPVIGFVKLPVKEQGKLFVEINHYQTSVNRNLLWDLAGDIYEGSEDPAQIEELTISNITKVLNLDKDSPLRGQIKIPSHSSLAKPNVTMTTICGSIKKHKLVTSPDFLARKRDVVDQEEYEKFAAERIKLFFGVLKELLPSDWEAGDEGYLRSNNGIAGMFLVLKQIFLYLNLKESQNIYTSKNTAQLKKKYKELLEPAILYLSEDDSRANEFRQRRGVAGQIECALALCQKINDRFSDFPLPKVRTQPKVPNLPRNRERATDEALVKAVETTELKLRDLVIDILIDRYGNDWYEKGILLHVKKKIEEMVEDRVSNFPYLKVKLMQDLHKRMEFTYVGDLLDIIVSKNNWPMFEPIFGRKSNVEAHLRDFGTLRNDKAHPKDIDQVVWDKGRGAIRWIDRCIETYYADKPEDE